jgi:hypothetical protein
MNVKYVSLSLKEYFQKLSSGKHFNYKITSVFCTKWVCNDHLVKKREDPY